MPSQFRKDSSSSRRMTKQIQSFIAPLKIHFWRSKSFLDVLESDPLHLKGNRR